MSVETGKKLYLIYINRSGEYQTVVKGYNTDGAKEAEIDSDYEPLFGEVFSNKSDYHQIFLNQNIIHTGNEIETSQKGRRYDIMLFKFDIKHYDFNMEMIKEIFCFKYFRNGKKLRPWSRNVPPVHKEKKHRNDNKARAIIKDVRSSPEYIKEPVFTTRLIASSDEYIKDDTERSDSASLVPEINDLADISLADVYSAPKPSNGKQVPNTSSFTPPNQIYFGFKPVVRR